MKCAKCGKDLSEAVELLGEDVVTDHENQHLMVQALDTLDHVISLVKMSAEPDVSPERKQKVLQDLVLILGDYQAGLKDLFGVDLEAECN